MKNSLLGLLICSSVHLQVIPGPHSQRGAELLRSDMREERNLRCVSGSGEHCRSEVDLRDHAYECLENCWPTSVMIPGSVATAC